VYREIEEYAAEGKDLTDFNASRRSVLSLPDDELIAEMRRIGVPDVATQGFIKRRKEVMDEFADANVSEETLRDASVRIMRERAREIIDGPMFDPAAQFPEGEDDGRGISDEDLTVDDADNVLDELDEISTIEAEDDDDDDFDEDFDAGFSSGAEPSETSEEAPDVAKGSSRASKITGTPEGRFGRRVSRFENRAGMQQRLSALELAGIRTDVRIDPQDRDRVTRYAMQFWNAFNQTGIALDMPADQNSTSKNDRAKKINDNIIKVGERMRARKQSDGQFCKQ
jgi:hypothetical protein